MMRRVRQNFLIYSFLGWILEGCYNLVVAGTFRKPNFLHIPLKPMYGIGGVMLAGSYKYDRKHFGYNCKLRYWDYSKEFLQFGGHICLKFALCWMVLAQLLAKVVHPFLELFLKKTGKLAVWELLYQLFFADCLLTIHQRRRNCLQMK